MIATYKEFSVAVLTFFNAGCLYRYEGNVQRGIQGGRSYSMHLQDVDTHAAGQPQVALSKGSIGWVKTLTAAKVGGAKDYFVDQNWELTQQSASYLKTLEV